jgi:membrane-associated phospholipid phosphatase
VTRLVLAFAPALFAVYVGITRVRDSKHHVTDVVAGSLLGTVIGAAFYGNAYYF